MADADPKDVPELDLPPPRAPRSTASLAAVEPASGANAPPCSISHRERIVVAEDEIDAVTRHEGTRARQDREEPRVT